MCIFWEAVSNESPHFSPCLFYTMDFPCTVQNEVGVGGNAEYNTLEDDECECQSHAFQCHDLEQEMEYTCRLTEGVITTSTVYRHHSGRNALINDRYGDRIIQNWIRYKEVHSRIYEHKSQMNSDKQQIALSHGNETSRVVKLEKENFYLIRSPHITYVWRPHIASVYRSHMQVSIHPAFSIRELTACFYSDETDECTAFKTSKLLPVQSVPSIL